MVVRKKTKVFFLTPTKKIKLRMACGLEKDVPGSEKREAEFFSWPLIFICLVFPFLVFNLLCSFLHLPQACVSSLAEVEKKIPRVRKDLGVRRSRSQLQDVLKPRKRLLKHAWI